MSALDSSGSYIIVAGRSPTYYAMQAVSLTLQRGDSVLCRTSRGVEIAEVMADHAGTELLSGPAKFIRKTREEDQFLARQLDQLSRTASEACQIWLEEQNSADVLLEVEPLFDGKTLFFHFLGEPTPSTEKQMERLAHEYQSTVASSRFAKLLETGCGPGCGTKDKSGCGTATGCAVCSIAGGCITSKKST